MLLGVLRGAGHPNATLLDLRVEASGSPPAGSSGFTATKLATGQYFVSFPAGTFTGCTPPIAIVVPTTGSLRFATVAGSQCSADGSGGFTVETYDDDVSFTQVDMPFNFMAR